VWRRPGLSSEVNSPDRDVIAQLRFLRAFAPVRGREDQAITQFNYGEFLAALSWEGERGDIKAVRHMVAFRFGGMRRLPGSNGALQRSAGRRRLPSPLATTAAGRGTICAEVV
jgi:hypothetical protein